MTLDCIKCHIQPIRHYLNNLTWLECPQCHQKGAGARIGPVYGQSTNPMPLTDSECSWNTTQKELANANQSK